MRPGRNNNYQRCSINQFVLTRTNQEITQELVTSELVVRMGVRFPFGIWMSTHVDSCKYRSGQPSVATEGTRMT